jgi:hypothetical protein
MSRTSPSGPISVTDEKRNICVVDPETDTPGAYYIAPLELLGISGQAPLPVNDANTSDIALFTGPETRSGRIGKARLTFIADAASAGSDPIVLQWTVNGLPVGKPVTIPWTTTPIPTTLAEALADVSGAPIKFPDVFWQPGDIVLLQLTLGTLVGTDQFSVGVTYEKNYTP